MIGEQGCWQMRMAFVQAGKDGAHRVWGPVGEIAAHGGVCGMGSLEWKRLF